MCEMKTRWYERQERSLKEDKKNKRNCLFRTFHIWVVIGTASSSCCWVCVARVFFGFSSAMRTYVWRISIRIKNAQNWNIHTTEWRMANGECSGQVYIMTCTITFRLRTHGKTAKQNLFYVNYVLDDVFGGIFSLLYIFSSVFAFNGHSVNLDFFRRLWVVLICFRGYQWNWYRTVVFPQTTHTRVQKMKYI